MLFKKIWEDERGMGIIEIAIIIVIIIAIALIFKTQIEALIETIFDKINSGVVEIW